jgi:hypothetical protein
MSQRETPPRHLRSFADLVAPLDPATFFSARWETAPLHLARSAPDYYGALLRANDLDFVITLACQLQNNSIDLLLKGQLFGAFDAPRHPKQLAEIFEVYKRGATVRVIGAHRYWKPLWTLCRDLQQELSFPVRANLYCSPPDSQGAELHYDPHDVFILQVAGSKRWRVYAPLERLPLEYYPSLPFEQKHDLEYRRGTARKLRVGIKREACGEPVLEETLRAGDLLYLPRGYVHEAWCDSEPSAHLSLGVHALTWTDAAAVALGRRANEDDRLRRALPIGFARAEKGTDGAKESNDTKETNDTNETNDAKETRGTKEANGAADTSAADIFRSVLEELASHASLRETLEEIAANAVYDQQSLGDGTIFEARASFDLSPSTIVERRPGLNLKLVRERLSVALLAGHSTLHAPAPLAAAAEFVARTPRFRVADLPGGLSDSGKVALARKLIQEGILRVAVER